MQGCACGDACRRVGDGIGVELKAGVNVFVIKYPKVLEEEYPAHVKAATFYGRLINHQYIININVALDYDDDVRSSHKASSLSC